MNDWKHTELSKLCSKIGDGLHGTPNYVDVSDFMFVNGNNLDNGRVIINSNTKCVDEFIYRKNYIHLDSNTLLISINGTIGNVAFYDNEKIMLGKSIAYLNFTSDINRFFFYYFQQSSILEHLHNISTGSTIKNLSLASLQNLNVPVPNRDQWEPICKILESIDAKIDHNDFMITSCRQFGRMIYSHWFIDLHFPFDGEETFAEASGPTEFCETLNRDIPLGWEVATLRNNGLSKIIDPGLDVFTCKKRYLATADLVDYSFNPNCREISFAGRESRANMQPILNSIWFAKMKKSKKFAFFSKESSGFIENYVLSTGFAGLDVKPIALEYMINVIDSEEFEIRKDFIANGATQEAINLQGMDLIPILIPDQVTLERFNSITSTLYRKIELITNENIELGKLKKSLLGLLMSGKVSINQ